MSNKHYTFDETERLARKAAAQVARNYGNHGTDYDMALSDIHEWMYTPRHQGKIKRWLAHEPQQTSRIFWSFVSAAQKPAEKRKAEMHGYEVDDIEWYTPALVTSLLPLALDPDYDGQAAADRERKVDINEKAAKRSPNHAETGNTLAQVVDVRRAISRLPDWVGVALADSQGYYDNSAVAAIVQYLGGPRPYVGRRRVISNATAQAMTGADYDGSS